MNVASLKAADKTWKKIHNYIKTKTLHLKLTKYVYKFNMKYEKIKRISTIVFIDLRHIRGQREYKCHSYIF